TSTRSLRTKPRSHPSLWVGGLGRFSPASLGCKSVLRSARQFVSEIAIAGAGRELGAKQKQPPPLCMTRQELERSTDVFTIELLDMAQHHRVLFGEDVLQGLQIDTHLHRVQVEYELREKLILLRQHILLAAESRSKLYDVLLHSAPSFATLLRHALIVLGGQTLL